MADIKGFVLQYRSPIHKLNKVLIANNTANIAENIVYVQTFWPSTGAIVNAKDQHR